MSCGCHSCIVTQLSAVFNKTWIPQRSWSLSMQEIVRPCWSSQNVLTTCWLSHQILTSLPVRMANFNALITAQVSARTTVCQMPGTPPAAPTWKLSDHGEVEKHHAHPTTLACCSFGSRPAPSVKISTTSGRLSMHWKLPVVSGICCKARRKSTNIGGMIAQPRSVRLLGYLLKISSSFMPILSLDPWVCLHFQWRCNIESFSPQNLHTLWSSSRCWDAPYRSAVMKHPTSKTLSRPCDSLSNDFTHCAVNIALTFCIPSYPWRHVICWPTCSWNASQALQLSSFHGWSLMWTDNPHWSRNNASLTWVHPICSSRVTRTPSGPGHLCLEGVHEIASRYGPTQKLSTCFLKVRMLCNNAYPSGSCAQWTHKLQKIFELAPALLSRHPRKAPARIVS